jgi:hypothetical protein
MFVILGMIRVYLAKSKPRQLNVNPKSAKSYMFDQYWKIAQMPASPAKEKARKQWDKELVALQQKLEPKLKELSVKVVD